MVAHQVGKLVHIWSSTGPRSYRCGRDPSDQTVDDQYEQLSEFKEDDPFVGVSERKQNFQSD